jgi:hypothetical protein
MTHFTKDESPGSYKSRDSLQTSRRAYTMKEIMSNGNINKITFYDVERSLKNFIASGGSADTVKF